MIHQTIFDELDPYLAQRRHLRELAAWLVLLNILDFAITVAGLWAGNEESNPLQASMGWPAFLTCKVLTVWLLVRIAERAPYRLGRRTLRIANVIYSGIVLWNVVLLVVALVLL